MDTSLKPFSLDVGRQTLRGTFYPAGGPERRRPAVVCLHGFTGNRMESDFMFVALARSLAAAGIHAVTFDFRGSGESDGIFSEMLVSGELKDAMRVLEWLPGRPGVDRSRVGLLGFSLGGLLASCASAKADIKALALLAPTTTQNLRRHAKSPVEGGPPIVGSHTLHRGFFDDLDKHDPLADLAQRPVPTLLVHGTADKAVPPKVAEQYEQALCNSGADLHLEWIEGAGHTFASPEQRKSLGGLVTRFFASKL